MASKFPRLAGLITIIFFGVCACTTPILKRSEYAAALTTEDVIRYTTDAIRQELDSGNVKGVSVALVDKTGIIWSKSFGLASMEGDTDLNSDTPLPIASVTKVFTSIAIQQLAERGKLDLDDALSIYIPELDFYHSSGIQPTVRDLLSHYSGVPSNHWAGYRYNIDEIPTLVNWSLELEDFPAQINPLHLVSKPGEAMIYSNLGYSLLGLIVQRTSGMAYTDYIKHNILEKVGMRNTAFVLNPNMERALHEQFIVMERIDHPVVRDLPAGGLMSSVIDLSSLLIALLNQSEGTLSAKTLRAMYSAQNDGTNTHGDVQMGLGVFLSPPGVPLGSASSRLPLSVSHGGDMGQYHSEIILLPDEELGVVVLTVSDKGRASTDRIADVALISTYESRAGALPKTSQVSTSTPHLYSAKPEKLAGYYATELGLMEIEAKQRKLRMKLDRIGSIKFDLESQKGGRIFSLSPKLLGFIPVPNFFLNLRDMTIVTDNGQESPQIWLAINNFRIMRLTQLEVKPIPDAWLNSVGEYKVSDPTGSIAHIEYFSINHDPDSGLIMVAMQARGKSKIELPLRIISDELAVIAGYGRDMGTLIQRLSNENLQYSGLIVTKTNSSPAIL
ncbi:serine hydrolase domain-containing protein [uncultured Microbulbifer sp.]|uniref:serine hydrolase domain-containing protein n=1 Tax=uncultured Microbulbifer sp. TaxID=348147 RepID=UPI00261BA13B|nr:serine hydrolase domain-containing protein [uncultured Microbulbifer sp.]